MTRETRGFSRDAAGFSSYDGDLRLPLGLALGSPIFPSGCEGTQSLLKLMSTESVMPSNHLILCVPFSSCFQSFPASVPLEWLRGSLAHRRALCGTHGSLRMMHGGGSARSCCAFTHRVAFEDQFPIHGVGGEGIVCGASWQRSQGRCISTS